MGIDTLPWEKRLLYAGAVVTLSGAVVALVVNYRKQRDAEDSRFSVSFAEAARQLGDDSPAVRIAGVFAIAALADQHADRRQQCIDVLCGYIRLPYNPQAGAGHLIERSIESTDVANVKTHERHAYRADDREVRLTITRVLRDRLRADAAVKWENHDFDFSGAIFDGADFSKAIFAGGKVSFAEARFSAGTIDFSEATFSGADVDFTRATLTGGRLNFTKAAFSGSDVNFYQMAFAGGEAAFPEAVFSGGKVLFLNTFFEGAHLDFFGTSFLAPAVVKFDSTYVTRGQLDFFGAKFRGGSAFFGINFLGGTARFTGALFEDGDVDFTISTPTEFRLQLDFRMARFKGGKIHLWIPWESFSGTVFFPQATFYGGRILITIPQSHNGEFIFDNTNWEGGSVVLCGQAVDSEEEAKRALATPANESESQD